MQIEQLSVQLYVARVAHLGRCSLDNFVDGLQGPMHPMICLQMGKYDSKNKKVYKLGSLPIAESPNLLHIP